MFWWDCPNEWELPNLEGCSAEVCRHTLRPVVLFCGFMRVVACGLLALQCFKSCSGLSRYERKVSFKWQN